MLAQADVGTERWNVAETKCNGRRFLLRYHKCCAMYRPGTPIGPHLLARKHSWRRGGRTTAKSRRALWNGLTYLGLVSGVGKRR